MFNEASTCLLGTGKAQLRGHLAGKEVLGVGQTRVSARLDAGPRGGRRAERAECSRPRRSPGKCRTRCGWLAMHWRRSGQAMDATSECVVTCKA